MRRGLLFLTLILVFSSFASAATATYSFDIHTDKVDFKTGIIYENSVVFEVTTAENSLCLYSESAGTSFGSMQDFDDNFETLHKKVFTNLPDGVHRYYVRCRPIDQLGNSSAGTAELEAAFTTSNAITGRIVMEQSPLKEGKYEITLLTSKIPREAPSLTYSYDGIVYNPIVLFGSGLSWRGYLIIPEDFGEKVGSFKFEAKDLEGRTGKTLIGENVFVVDTKKPLTLTSIDANGEFGQIRLEWSAAEEDDIDKINVYRSESPGVDLTDFLEDIDSNDDDFIDNGVSLGKTYYYKLAAEDDAGNIGDLSREITVTVRRDNISTGPSGLASNLIGSVDALLTEVSLIEDDISRIKSTFELESSEDIEKLDLDDNLRNAETELSAIKRDINNLKLQDLDKTTLDTKLDSSTLRLNVLRKKIPESFTLLEENSIDQSLSDEIVRTAIVEHSPEIEPSTVDKMTRTSLKEAEENSLKIKSTIKIFEINYLDGTSNSKTIVDHIIEGTFEDSDNSLFILRYPPSLFSSSSLELTKGSSKENSENILSFETGTKEISYVIDKELNKNDIEEINLSPMITIEEGSSLTGYFLSDIPGTGSIGVTVLILLAISLVSYLGYMKRVAAKDIVEDFLEKAKEVKHLQNKGDSSKAKSLYEELQRDYSSLTESQKHKVFGEVKKLAK